MLNFLYQEPICIYQLEYLLHVIIKIRIMTGFCLVDIEIVIISESVFEWEIQTFEFRKVYGFVTMVY
jgi:hypothetical protein